MKWLPWRAFGLAILVQAAVRSKHSQSSDATARHKSTFLSYSVLSSCHARFNTAGFLCIRYIMSNYGKESYMGKAVITRNYA
jgi:hypothetical protein